MIIADKIYSTVANKCPRCHSGKMFENNNPQPFERFKNEGELRSLSFNL